MKRRQFNQAISACLALHPLRNHASWGQDGMERIAMSTVHFRDRFSGTRSRESAYQGTDLALTEVPAFFRDRFGLPNVEFWSKHFESLEPTYLKTLKKKIKKSKSTLINIQCDESYQLGDPDPIKRKEGLALALRWVEAANMIGSGGIRFNPGQGDVDQVIDALQTINAKAKNYGIALMTENHFGMEMDVDVHLKITKAVGENMYTLPDFGNYADEDRYTALEKIMPYAYQVSAKTIEFDAQKKHVSFDFDRCMKIAVDSGFKGIYSIEQWSPKATQASDEEMADWMIDQVKSYV